MIIYRSGIQQVVVANVLESISSLSVVLDRIPAASILVAIARVNIAVAQ